MRVSRIAEPKVNVAGFSNDTYILFREFVRERVGIVYSEPRRRIFENRILSRIRALELESGEAYFRYLSFHPNREQEFLQLVSVLTNNETFFFREPATLEAVIARIRATPSKGKIRILSAGASSGEELSTVAILARIAGIDLERLELTGIDIDVAMIEHSRDGRYRNKSFRNTDPENIVRFFVPDADVRRLKPAIHQHLEFRWANLVDETTLRFPHSFDVILCRNVLIYFDSETVERVVRSFHGLLADDGVLVTGLSESLASLPFLFDPIRDDGVVLYTKVPL